ncbi:MAG: outer membrane lipoprotein-sorting protein [Sphingomonadales bacterium]
MTPARAVIATLACVGIALVADLSSAAVETPEGAGLRIASEADRRGEGFGDHTAELRMILTNRHGDVAERLLRISTLEVDEPGQGDKTLVVFDTPRDIKGTALLTFSKVLEPDDQWLFLPALKRVKRISSARKSGPFMGSEFAFEDMAPPEVGKFDYRFLRDEACGEFRCFVIERTPRYRYSGYRRQIVWLDHGHYRIFRVEFYDRRDALLKTLIASDYRIYNGKYWRAHDLLMENHQTGKKTRLLWSAFQFAVGLTERDFTRGSLTRSR